MDDWMTSEQRKTVILTVGLDIMVGAFVGWVVWLAWLR